MSEPFHEDSSHLELPVLALRNMILFPGTVIPVEVGRKSSLRLLDEVSHARPPRLLVATQVDPQVEEPDAKDIHPIAVEAELVKLIRIAPDRVTAVLKGLFRRAISVVHTEPYLVAKVAHVPEVSSSSIESAALMLTVRESVQKLGDFVPKIARDLLPLIGDIHQPGALADVVSSYLELASGEQLALLLEMDPKNRLEMILVQIQRRIEVIRLKDRIDGQVREEMSRQQREIVLRQSMKAIQEELGERDGDDDLNVFEERISASDMPEEVRVVARRQFTRLKNIPSGSPEYTVQRTYLEWLCELPWNKLSMDQLELGRARQILEADHYGLEKVKKRMLEYLAVRRLAPKKKGPILCLVGPPGVGKTSLGRSLAKALGREFIRISLGGVRDEAEIRGHRRTYIGALPGRIIQALRRAGTRNPLLLLDEVDKLGADHRGDPSSALLEVLDPEQNSTFSDHYIELNFDLSDVIFVCTANSLDTIPAPLRDRMEIIELPGYTVNEKRAIAINHLIPKQLVEHGLRLEKIAFSDQAVNEIIESYTREAGVRNLEREISGVIRGLAMKVAAAEVVPERVDVAHVNEYLGHPRFYTDIAEHMNQLGIATGLAWTPVGGDILFIEVSEMVGKGHFTLTGQLGSVMKESAQAALSWVRAHGDALDIPASYFEKTDLHLHVPHGAIAKDGPSAGVAILTAMVSRITRRPVRYDVAMTGEISLRGAVLPVGGIKEKVLAAHRAGIKKVILPERNLKDLVDVPLEVKNQLNFVLVRRVEDVLTEAIDGFSKDSRPGTVKSGAPMDMSSSWQGGDRTLRDMVLDTPAPTT